MTASRAGRAAAGEPGDDSRAPGAFTRHFEAADAIETVVEIAHDMRSPLTSILFLVDTLRRGASGPLTPAQERQLGLIYGAALGLNTLAADVMDAVRGARGLFEGDPVPMSLSAVVLAVCETVRPISEEKRLPIHYTLPQPDTRMGHPAALTRVLLNLVTNALKYTREGSVSIDAVPLQGDTVRFCIADTGDGIPPMVIDRLFESFRPAVGGRMRFSNAGLGLAICQQFLAMMGSALRVESAPGQGTRFTFDLELPAVRTVAARSPGP